LGLNKNFTDGLVIQLFNVIAISKGCAKPISDERKKSRKSISKLHDMLLGEKYGAILAINESLYNAIKEEMDDTDQAYDSTLDQILRKATGGRMILLPNIPVFAVDGNNDEDFSNLSLLYIQKEELDNSAEWKYRYDNEPFNSDGSKVRVRRFDQIEPESLEPKILENQRWTDFEDLLYIPIIWSQRIRIIDPYFMKNSATQATVPSLERLIDSIIEARKTIGKPLKLLEFTIHYRIQNHDDTVFSEQDAVNHLTSSIAKFPDIYDWIKEIKLRWYRNQMDNTDKKRPIIFENNSHGICFPASRGIELKRDGTFRYTIEFNPPCTKQKMEKWKQKLNDFCEQAFPSDDS